MSMELVLYGKGKGKGLDDPSKRARRTIDYGSTIVRWLEECLDKRLRSQQLQSHYSYTKEMLPPFATPTTPHEAICCRFVHASTQKSRAPVNVVHWFPNGRRLLSGSQTGEITIWNGFQFHFENILQAHNAAVKAMEWTPEETVLVSGDQLGIIKFWDQYLYNFQSFQAHKESICDISISPTGLKFCSCADDSHAKVWDLRTGEEERAFTGHGWDVKCCSWHPSKGLVATGSKDSQIKLWDPRASEAITTIFCHKNTVTRVKWSPTGQCLASGSRDQLVMLMDVRTMSVRQVFKAHQKEVTSLCWHPETDALLASGGYDNNLHFWDTQGGSSPIKSVPGAHEGPIWSLAWHPLGHLLASASHDYSTRFWSRGRPGDGSFVDLLPRKVAAPDPTAAAFAAAVCPLTTNAVLEAGIFAGPPAGPPPPAPKVLEGVAGGADRDAATSGGEEKPPSKPALGLSMGEGADRKDVLDTSDFDAEDRGPGVPEPTPATQAAPPAQSGSAAATQAATPALKSGEATAAPEPTPKASEAATPALKSGEATAAPEPTPKASEAVVPSPADNATPVESPLDPAAGTKRQAEEQSSDLDAKRPKQTPDGSDG